MRRIPKKSSFALSPPTALVALYLAFIIFGSLVLSLPISHHGGVSFGDALFTSVSAVTVTGLFVVDTGSAFTWFGQFIITLLIQVGGLGLMTFSVLLFSALGIKVGLPQQFILREDLRQTSLSNLAQLARLILRIAGLCELIGLVVLSFVFVPHFGWIDGIWQAFFHSVSAFNNAGFQLSPNGLMDYVDNPIINLSIPALFIAGGLGFVVISEVVRVRRWKGLSLHSKLTLSGTAVLIVIGSVLFGALEWNNPQTLGALPDNGARIWASWFQGVAPRTAGFNSINTGGIHDSTAMLTMFLMFVGGGSASTAGGIKVTSLLVLILATLAFFRRQSDIHAFGRSLGVPEIMKVMALATSSIMLIFTALFLICISHDGRFLNLAFEVVSAFGTVGLSMGATAELDPLGRTLIAILMFLGRVGPLTMGFLLATRINPRVQYASSQVFIG